MEKPYSDTAHTTTTESPAPGLIRAASVKLMEARLPPGAWAATATSVSKAPSLTDIRKGAFDAEGWNEDAQRQRAGSGGSQGGLTHGVLPTEGPYRVLTPNSEAVPLVAHERTSYEASNRAPQYDGHDKDAVSGLEAKHSSSTGDGASRQALRHSGEYANGYTPPPKLPWTRTLTISLTAFWKWCRTPTGFLITLYALNVVGWGGMLFLLLCNAAPAMCIPSCNDINSPRRKWVEWDSQILNALFCVTGFGLAPWRARDLYWWTLWRVGGKTEGIRRIAGIHRGWFRLPNSNTLPELADADSVDPNNPAVPIPVSSIPDPPPTGARAPSTQNWKVDFVLWMNMWNTFFQIVLCFYMWHYDRIERPSWATGMFVALGCGVAGAGGVMMWREGKGIKKVEGVPMEGRPDVEAGEAGGIPLVRVVAGKAGK
ncbi:hypothetical protein P153DRAFT_397337 [Dothidotthia symphoricarpi CBS 119687]|uniref:Uncharacterized protein n=1 Tax=Dothidotthia symphoricarpi CBS 119687 TaxID=1392245 RepID=A0A6A6ADG8_9PLEO|nr:uncharacterized protein P153DRAFT_397337 [Dothidotthia symphoricarpi CBS 119687]KAF2129165.1 hypothetical protein P153DRAFT_397337 [Dothidotthia symphoricarpi CBS 119687]